MKLPRSITIRGKKWKVVRGDPGDGHEGECDPATRTITIAERLDAQDTEAVFWHEILHALLPEAQIIVSERTEEIIVELLSQRIGGVLKQIYGVRR